jgi:hypothetical protein
MLLSHLFLSLPHQNCHSLSSFSTHFSRYITFHPFKLCPWCGYEVTGVILLHDLKGVMQLDRSKDVSLHVSVRK